MTISKTTIRKTLLPLVLVAAAAAHAQGPTPGPTPPPPPPPPARLTPPGDHGSHSGRAQAHTIDMHLRNPEGPGASAMGIVPSGTWWRSPNTIRDLALTPDQQKRMEDIFRQNRLQLIDLHASLEKEQVNLEPLLNTNPPDQGKALAQISRIADLRADLEKANAKMLLGLRAQLTADQWTKLQSLQPSGLHMESYGRVGPVSPVLLFKRGESRNTNTTTCTAMAGQPGSRCSTTTVTVKDDNGRPITTTCVTEPGQSTPRCSTSPAGHSSSFLMPRPLDPAVPPAAPSDLPTPPTP